jgi:hypothetical protein
MRGAAVRASRSTHPTTPATNGASAASESRKSVSASVSVAWTRIVLVIPASSSKGSRSSGR